jgi:hypothetical protein
VRSQQKERGSARLIGYASQAIAVRIDSDTAIPAGASRYLSVMQKFR